MSLSASRTAAPASPASGGREWSEPRRHWSMTSKGSTTLATPSSGCCEWPDASTMSRKAWIQGVECMHKLVAGTIACEISKRRVSLYLARGEEPEDNATQAAYDAL